MTTQIPDPNAMVSQPALVKDELENISATEKSFKAKPNAPEQTNSENNSSTSAADRQGEQSDIGAPQAAPEGNNTTSEQLAGNASPPASPTPSYASGSSALRHQQIGRRSQRPSLNGNASLGNMRASSSRSLVSGSPPTISRPAGMRERIQERLRTAQSERHLNAYGSSSQNLHDADDTSMTSASMRSRRSSAPFSSSSSVRERLSTSWSQVPSIRRIAETAPISCENDDSLLLQLTQKVRQLEEEKGRLVANQEELEHRHESKVEYLQAKLKQAKAQADAERPSSPSTPTSAMLELQAKLDTAMLKIARLEEEQSNHDNLEEKYQDAQVIIANLRLQATTPMRRLSIGSVGTTNSMTSEALRMLQKASEQREDERSQDDGQVDVDDDEQRKSISPPSVKDRPPRPRAGSFDTTTTSASTVDPGNTDEDQQSRTDKLQKLKDFRRSRESQLKELVLDSQNSPTDVQSVIRNLQDELKAAKQVMAQQKLQLQEQEDKLRVQESQINGAVAEADSLADDDELSTLREKYRSLQRRHSRLEMDRAWSEFQLRDRITNDALKFHRRLRHWKEQSEEIQKQLEETMELQAAETKKLREQLAHQEEMALAAEQDLREYKRGMEKTLKEFGATQERLTRVTSQLAMYRPEPTASDPTLLQQAQFLELAKERKEEKNVWSNGWIGKIRQRVGEADPASKGEKEASGEKPHVLLI